MKETIKIVKSILKSKIRNQPYKLNYAITSACNSQCKTCNVWKNFRNNPEIIKDDLTIEEVKLIFKNLPSSFVWLSLSGGEPFLRTDLFQICQAAVEKISNLGLISIPTNGLTTKRIITTTKRILKLPLKNLFLNFSLDGPPKIHNEIRGIKKAYQKTWSTYQAIQSISKKSPKLNVNLETTISKYNINHLEPFFQKLVTNNHKLTITIAHTGYLYKNINENKEFTELKPDGRKLKRIISIVRKGLDFFTPTDLIELIYLDKILDFYHNPDRQPIPCIALKSSIALDAQGNITPCFMWGKELGNIKNFNYNFQTLWKRKSSEIKNIRKIIEKEKCPNCWTPCEAYQSIINNLLTLNPAKIKEIL